MSIHRTPELTLDDDGTWRDVRGNGWLCHKVANKLWNLDGYEKIRICVSSNLVPNEIRFTRDRFTGWNNVRSLSFFRGSEIPCVWLSNWLWTRFPEETAVWARIEEA